eukprot:4430129-Prymnesium_polylepis.1
MKTDHDSRRDGPLASHAVWPHRISRRIRDGSDSHHVHGAPRLSLESFCRGTAITILDSVRGRH